MAFVASTVIPPRLLLLLLFLGLHLTFASNNHEHLENSAKFDDPDMSPSAPHFQILAATPAPPPPKGTFIFVNWLDPTNSLPVFLFQVFLTLCITRICGKILSFMRQPPVIGEIIGGIILGPSVLGLLPNYTATVWPSTGIPSLTTFTVVANIGLIFFMFVMGMELDPALMAKQWRSSVPIATSAIIVPFSIGTALSVWLQNINNQDNGPTWVEPNFTAFVLFCGTSMSFTAFPVLASILSATRLLTTPLGIQAMSCAAIDDIMAWCILAIASSFSKSGNAANGGWTCLLAFVFVLFMLLVIKPILAKIHDYYYQARDEFNKFFVVGVFMLLISGAMCAELIGIHAFFGSFIVGIVIPRKGNFLHDLTPKVELITREFLLPLFFAASGIKTNIGSLNRGEYWGITIALIIIAFLVKFTPSTLMTKLLTKRGWKYSCTIGILMNTRGLVELIALNVGRDSKVLSPRMFTILVIMAVVTTVVSSPLMWLIYQRRYNSELEQEKREAIRRMGLIQDAALEKEPEDAPVVFNDDGILAKGKEETRNLSQLAEKDFRREDELAASDSAEPHVSRGSMAETDSQIA